jgi:Topoisomerase DNA binding C4 zinc finger
MEGLLVIGGICGAFWFISLVAKYIDKRHRETRDAVYHELLDDERINQEIHLYKSRLESLKSTKIGSDEIERTYYRGRVPKYYQFSLKCSECENGKLRIRKGPYGTFYGCSNYPSCKNKMNTQLARQEIKKEATTDFSEDFLKAYS